MTEESVLENWIDRLREAVLAEVTSPLAIPAAKGIEWIALDEGWTIPDWVYALANGNPNREPEVIKAIRSFIRAEEGGEK